MLAQGRDGLGNSAYEHHQPDGRCLEPQGLLEQDTESSWLERVATANGFSLHARVN